MSQSTVRYRIGNEIKGLLSTRTKGLLFNAQFPFFIYFIFLTCPASAFQAYHVKEAGGLHVSRRFCSEKRTWGWNLNCVMDP